MSTYETYREQIDYTWVIARQLDRILEKRSKIHIHLPKIDYERAVEEFKAALLALYYALPRKIRNEINFNINANLKELDKTLSEIIDAIEKRGLLIKKKTIMMGVEEIA